MIFGMYERRNYLKEQRAVGTCGEEKTSVWTSELIVVMGMVAHMGAVERTAHSHRRQKAEGDQRHEQLSDIGRSGCDNKQTGKAPPAASGHVPQCPSAAMLAPPHVGEHRTAHTAMRRRAALRQVQRAPMSLCQYGAGDVLELYVCWTMRVYENGTAKLCGCLGGGAVKLWDCGFVKLWDCVIVELLDSGAAKLWNCEVESCGMSSCGLVGWLIYGTVELW